MKNKTKAIYVFAFAFLFSLCAFLALPKTANASQTFEQMISLANSGDTVTITQDYQADSQINIAKNLVIDLGGNTLRVRYGFVVSGSANVTIKNGTITVFEPGYSAIEVNYATLTAQNVNFGFEMNTNSIGIRANNAKLVLENCTYYASTNTSIYSANSELKINGGNYYAKYNAIQSVGGNVEIKNATIKNCYNAVETQYRDNCAVLLGYYVAIQQQVNIDGGEIESIYCGENVTVNFFGVARKIFNEGYLYLNGGLVGNASAPFYNKSDTALVNEGYAEINGAMLSADDQSGRLAKTIINKGYDAYLVINDGMFFGGTTVLETETSSEISIAGGLFYGKISLVRDYTCTNNTINSVSDMFKPGYFGQMNGAFPDMSGTSIDVSNLNVVQHVHTGSTPTCKTRATCSVCHNAYGEYDKTNHETPIKTYEYCPTEGKHYVRYICCDSYIAENHVEGSYQIVRMPTADRSGQKISTCTVCGRTWYQDIPPLTEEEQIAMAMAENVVAFMFLLAVVWVLGMIVAIAFIVSDIKKKKEKRAKIQNYINDFNYRKKNNIPNKIDLEQTQEPVANDENQPQAESDEGVANSEQAEQNEGDENVVADEQAESNPSDENN